MITAMPREDPTPSGGIDDTTEWKLISGLRQYGPLFSRPGGIAPGRTRTQELRNAINSLDLQIRRTFTVLQLDLLLYLDSETEDNVSESSSDSETDEDSAWDGSDSDSDDASSQSSVESQLTTPSDDGWDAPGQLSSPSADDALEHLSELCSLLEARVNPLLIPVEPGFPGDGDRGQGYPRLTRLIKQLESLSHSSAALDFIPSPKSTPTQFLFNIADDTATADAFVSFSNPTQKRPHKETRRQMVTKAKFLESRFFAFNSFVDKLQISAASLDSLSKGPSESSTSNESFASFALLQKFRQQTATACRAILSQFNYCDHREFMKHKILLQLPGWEDISSGDTPEATKNPPVQLFFTMCPRTIWQPARMYFLHDRPEHMSTCVQRKLCQALSNSHIGDRDLEFYVSEDCKSAGNSGIPIHIPEISKETRSYGDSFPDDKKSLWDLVKGGHFAKEETPDFVYTTNGKGVLVRLDQRKTLAAKLVIGLMLSMNSDHVFESWNPRRIYFLKPVDTHYSPFIPISTETSSSKRRKCLKLYLSDTLLEDGHDLQPLPQLTLLAKALFQIARGDRLDSVKISLASEEAFQDSWKHFRRLVRHYTQKVTCESEVDLEALPFLKAAEGCLDFHKEYQNSARGAHSSQRMNIAWKVVFDTILAEIDVDLKKLLATSTAAAVTKEDLLPVACQPAIQTASVISLNTTARVSSCTTVFESTLKKISTQYVGAETAQPSPHVQLFDAKQTTRPSTANDFWNRLDKFHKSYSRFVKARTVTESGAESPRRIRIAVLDTGIDFSRPDIMEAMDSGRIKKDWCHSWVGGDANDDEKELHGTNCAYLLHKVAPEADIYVGKVFNQNVVKRYEAKNIAKAIKHAADKWQVDIISMSFGLRPPEAQGNDEEDKKNLHEYNKIVDDIQNAIEDASVKRPRLMFAAASNNGKNDPRAFPANYNPYVFCVHASEGNGYDGGINPAMEPGFNFMTLGMGLELIGKEPFIKGGRLFAKPMTVVKSGTSFATPIAAGITATVLDLAARVEGIDRRAREKMKKPAGMEKVLRLMSTPQGDVRDRLYYMAPWHHWKSGWEMKESGRSRWDTINELF